MLGYIWMFMIIVSFFCSVITGNIENLAISITEGADKAIKLLLSMAGVMCLWTGIMKIADKSGLTALLAKLLSPVLCRLMPDYEKGSEALQAVAANITANFLGLGNAATPLGIKAMKEMTKHNSNDTPNNSMIMFVVLNTASMQLIPSTIAALRHAAGSEQPYSILVYIWVSSAAALIAGIISAKLFGLWRKNG